MSNNLVAKWTEFDRFVSCFSPRLSLEFDRFVSWAVITKDFREVRIYMLGTEQSERLEKNGLRAFGDENVLRAFG